MDPVVNTLTALLGIVAFVVLGALGGMLVGLACGVIRTTVCGETTILLGKPRGKLRWRRLAAAALIVVVVVAAAGLLVRLVEFLNE